MISLVVKVKPAAFKDEISFDAEGDLTIKIRERPIDGAANDYLIRFLAKEWNLRKSDILLEKGLSSRFKKILLNIDTDELEKILNKYRI
jgi:hypothetical protein